MKKSIKPHVALQIVLLLAVFGTIWMSWNGRRSSVASKHEKTSLHNELGSAFVNAAFQYAKDLQSKGQPVPESVTLEEFKLLGYLSEQDALPFKGTQVRFYKGASETHPQSILIEVTFPDGGSIQLCGDGSIQQGNPRGLINKQKLIRHQ